MGDLQERRGEGERANEGEGERGAIRALEAAADDQSEQRIIWRQPETMTPIEFEGDVAFDESMGGEHVEVAEEAL